MKAFRIKQRTSNGFLQFDVPKDFYDTELEVIVLSINENDETTSKEEADTKLARLQSYLGTVQYPNKSVNEDEVYYQ